MLKRSQFLPLIVAASFFSCGENDDELLITERPEPIAVVFSLDFPDVYGRVELEIDGFEVIHLDEDSLHDCERPTFLLEAKEASFRAISSRQFYWQGHVERDPESSCITISLEAKTLGSGVLYLAYRDVRSECFPVDFSLSIDGREEEWMGSIVKSGARFDLTPPYERGAKESLIFHSAREGSAVAVGGGPGERRTYRYRLQGPCDLDLEEEVVAPYSEEQISGTEYSIGI